jgi:hypothetical protein
MHLKGSRKSETWTDSPHRAFQNHLKFPARKPALAAQHTIMSLMTQIANPQKRFAQKVKHLGVSQ